MPFKILVAEDDKFLGKVYKAKFVKEGYEVQSASDGNEVFNILQNFMPDVILLDLIMPIKDGFITLKELKLNDKFKNIPVIIASNLGQKDEIEKGLNLGAADYLVKSDTTIEKVIEKVRMHIINRE
ncbi:hypothetical protein A3F07_02025 [candidate division WWE3 bacterium RIFCSPHIGHO2_12_FULL_38_15]|uniref:Response regulatory domain-containing protein n=1 Tax=candidate division WWE3 bacterium RIFCSPHIGHO2_02_FULL_38_14 TaxID=1802620 RepID=A0A1F4V8D6_UNCKA|nr:MAG: hypothetical protein A2793_03260 [candidate division WWE3 bacterium RIFCSPHIGHO2_01_FULL_38_45]OGC48658.1 MAG: hypothetical protein A3F07_02025 [candidate division WWE3 bacterium RIFCSPHIGHO2_12_FULL_38_15]OGC53064.1 MAG: hypothetical protein A3B64_01285 [candidate division WWE3 bacterium RIFCSPLOWO2_01_FULL_37_24]OGC53427.1 MAG: hypothetical protein A3D91_00140 [candidate division WWE3 bacterium RIFCSPHIGHO2_02_FULL_38_14]HLB51901.1 response regulator [Patescibacteria group bacterium]